VRLAVGDGPREAGLPASGYVFARVDVTCVFGTFEVCATEKGVLVGCWSRSFREPLWRVFCYCSGKVASRVGYGRSEAMKFIKTAVAAAEKGPEGDMLGDEALHKGRPALREFMTCIGNKKDGLREASPLMVACVEDGVRVGLKDDDAGGWCWRWGKSWEEALDALEKALQSGEGAFRGQKKGRGKK